MGRLKEIGLFPIPAHPSLSFYLTPLLPPRGSLHPTLGKLKIPGCAGVEGQTLPFPSMQTCPLLALPQGQVGVVRHRLCKNRKKFSMADLLSK